MRLGVVRMLACSAKVGPLGKAFNHFYDLVGSPLSEMRFTKYHPQGGIGKPLALSSKANRVTSFTGLLGEKKTDKPYKRINSLGA